MNPPRGEPRREIIYSSYKRFVWLRVWRRLTVLCHDIANQFSSRLSLSPENSGEGLGAMSKHIDYDKRWTPLKDWSKTHHISFSVKGLGIAVCYSSPGRRISEFAM
jgi:hypothetical protein